MWWMWIVGPIVAGLIFVLTSKVDQRVLDEIEAWREALGARRAPKPKKGKTADAKKKKKKAKDPRPKQVNALPREFATVRDVVGEGQVVGQYELAPKVAYAWFVTGGGNGGSDHQTVLVRLAEPGPTFVARPLPLLDENTRVMNTGIVFKKDPLFSSAYLIEADVGTAKAINAWLSKDLRKLMREHGEIWLHVRGKTLALTVYGTIRAEKMAALLELADVLVAEHGAEDGPSLFGEEERTRVKEEDDADEDDTDEDDTDEDDEDEEEEGRDKPATDRG